MILIIDNYDSFTYNLVQRLGELGAKSKVIRNDAIHKNKLRNYVTKISPSHIVISPGPCTPNEAGISNAIIKEFAGKIPILGVCLGHQCIGQVFGGKIVRAFPAHGKTAEIFHDGKTIYKNIKNPFTATRYHSLVVEKKSLPRCLEISAWSKDKNNNKDKIKNKLEIDNKTNNYTNKNSIMGLRHKLLPGVEGIQVHPESIMTSEGYKILRNFLNLKL